MDSPPTSDPNWRFLTVDGQPIPVPREWEPALIEVDVAISDWERVRVEVQGVELPVQLRHVNGVPRIVAPWERAGAGRHRICVRDGHASATRHVTITPAKITERELHQMVDDLESRLAPTIALSLQSMGAFAGLEIRPPGDETVNAELARTRIALHGDRTTRGLVETLPHIAANPHAMLRGEEIWVRSELARRPAPDRLAMAYSRPSNLTDAGSPLSVTDRRVHRSVDLYENQLVRLFVSRLDRRLRRIERLAAGPARDHARSLRHDLTRCVAQAPFLREVSEPSRSFVQVTMVLLKRPEYRSTMEAYQRYLRHVTVDIDDRATDAPLDDVPHLYELWGTLQVVDALLGVATAHGFRVQDNSLVRRVDDWLRITTGRSAVRLVHPTTQAGVTLKVQARYPGSRDASVDVTSLHSITYTQLPDVAIEMTPHGSPTSVIIFDPKYKLTAPQDDDEAALGGPVKADIDKMHAYRDAIRGPGRQHIVDYAAILYPGRSIQYGTDLGAVQCRPAAQEELATELDALLDGRLRALSTPPSRSADGRLQQRATDIPPTADTRAGHPLAGC